MPSSSFPPPPSPGETASKPGEPVKLRSTCDACQKAKHRCSREQPCQHCKYNKVPCVYSALRRIGRPPRRKPPGDAAEREKTPKRSKNRAFQGNNTASVHASEGSPAEPPLPPTTTSISIGHRAVDSFSSSSSYDHAFLLGHGPAAAARMDDDAWLEMDGSNHDPAGDPSGPPAFDLESILDFDGPTLSGMTAGASMAPSDQGPCPPGTEPPSFLESFKSAAAPMGDAFLFLENPPPFESSAGPGLPPPAPEEPGVGYPMSMPADSHPEGSAPRPQRLPSAPPARHCECYQSVLASLGDFDRRTSLGLACSIDMLVTLEQSAHRQAAQVLQCQGCSGSRPDLLLLVALKIDNTVGMLESVSKFNLTLIRPGAASSLLAGSRRSSCGACDSASVSSGGSSQGSRASTNSLSGLMNSRRLLAGAFEIQAEEKIHFFKQFLCKRLRRLSSVLQQLQQRMLQAPQTSISQTGFNLVSENRRRLQSVIGRLELWQG